MVRIRPATDVVATANHTSRVVAGATNAINLLEMTMLERRTFGLTVLAAVALAGATTQAAVVGITGITPSPGTTAISGPYMVTGFTTGTGASAVTTTTIAGATSAAVVAGSPSGQLTNNYFGRVSGTDENAASLNGLDVSTGVVNIGDAVNVVFGTTLLAEGASGASNDLFITEFGGSDQFTLSPIDASGSVIGNFSLTVQGSSFTIFAQIDSTTNASGNVGTDLRGIAFDLSDFVGTGTLSGVAGIRINSGGGDPGVVAFNTQAVAVPEPTALALLAAAPLALLRRRRA